MVAAKRRQKVAVLEKQAGANTARVAGAVGPVDGLAMARFAGLVIMTSLVFLVFWIGSHDGLKIKTTIFYIGVVVLGAAWIVPALFSGEIRFVTSKVTLPAVAFVIFSGLSLLIFPYKETIWSEFSRRAAYFLLYLITINSIATRSQLRWFARFALMTAAPIVVYGFSQHFGHDLLGVVWSDKANVQLRIISTLGNATYLAAYLIVMIPVGIACYIESRSLTSKILCGVMVGAMQVALLWTWSRGAWIGLSVGLLLSLALLAWTLRKRASDLWKPLTALAMVLVVATALGSYRTDVLGRAKSVTDKDLSNVQRVTQWRASWKVFTDHPILGVGVGATAIHMVPHLTPAFYATSKDVISGHPHNEFLEILAEGGIVGGALFAWLLAAVAISGVGVMRRAARTGDREMVVAQAALLGGLAAFLLANIGGLTMRCTYGGVLFWLATGVVVACQRIYVDSDPDNGEPKMARKAHIRLPEMARGLLALTAVGMVIAVAYFSVQFLKSDIYLGKGDRYLEAGDPASAEEEFRTSLLYNRYNVLAAYKLANALAGGGNNEEALARCKEVMRMSPDYARIHNYTGRVYFALGDYENALSEVRKSIKIDGLPGSYAELSRVQEATGDQKSALASLKHGLALLKVSPDGEDSLWNRESKRLVRLQVEIHPNQDPSEALEELLPDSKYASAIRIALGDHYSDRRNWKRAEAELGKAIEANPDNPPAYDRLAFVCYQQSKYQEAAETYTVMAALLEKKSDYSKAYFGALLNGAKTFMQLGNRAAAVTKINKIIELAPGSPEAQEAEGLLYRNYAEVLR